MSVWLIVAWSLQRSCKLPKGTREQSRLIGFEDTSSPMSRALESVPRVGGKGAKETISKGSTWCWLRSNKQVSLVVDAGIGGSLLMASERNVERGLAGAEAEVQTDGKWLLSSLDYR